MLNLIKCRGRSMGYAQIYAFYSTYVLCSLCSLVDLTNQSVLCHHHAWGHVSIYFVMSKYIDHSTSLVGGLCIKRHLYPICTCIWLMCLISFV